MIVINLIRTSTVSLTSIVVSGKIFINLRQTPNYDVIDYELWQTPSCAVAESELH